MTLWLALIATDARAEDPAAAQDIAPALAAPKKAKWEAKGKALDPYGLGNTKRKQEAWTEAIPLLVDSLKAQPGCGQCLDALARTLSSAKRYDDALSVARFLDAQYPDRTEGKRRISDTLSEAQRVEECVEATSRLLEVEKADLGLWWRRNRLLLQLGRFDDAKKMLEGAVAAGISKENTACLQIQVLSAQADPAGARELWATCNLGDNLDLRHYSEGWLAMAEDDLETAAKRLVIGAGDDFARLTVAWLRLDQGKPELAMNLISKINENPAWSWAIDLHLAHALALNGTGKAAEARDVLEKTLMADGWPEKHRAYSLESVMLKPHGNSWPATVGLRASALEIGLLVAAGDLEKAKAVHADAVAVYGEKPELASLLPPEPAPAPAPSTAKKKP